MNKRGFTLLELLLTLSLFAAIMGLLMNVFFDFKEQTARFDSHLNLRQEARVLEHLLRQDLQAAVYLIAYADPKESEDEGNLSGIVGFDEQSGDRQKDRLHMHVNRPVRFFRGLSLEQDPEIHEVSYFLDEESEGRIRFKRREQFYVDSDMTEGDESISHTLSENVIGFDVKYYLSTGQESLDEWGTPDIKREFDKAVGIPAGAVVTLKLRDLDGETFESHFQINLQPDMGAGIEWKKE